MAGVRSKAVANVRRAGAQSGWAAANAVRAAPKSQTMTARLLDNYRAPTAAATSRGHRSIS